MSKDVYIIIETETHHELAHYVNKKLKEGYNIVNSYTCVSVNPYNRKYSQPMMLKSVLENSSTLV